MVGRVAAIALAVLFAWPLVPPALAQPNVDAPGPTVLATDPTGDATVPPTVGADGTHPLSILDIVALGVSNESERAIGLFLRLSVLETVAVEDADQEGPTVTYHIRFRPGQEAVRYDVRFDGRVARANEDTHWKLVEGSLKAELNVCSLDWDDCVTRWTSHAKVDRALRELSVAVPRTALSEVPTDQGVYRWNLTTGRTLIEFYASAWSETPGTAIPQTDQDTAFWWALGDERAPDTAYGSLYTFRTPGPSTQFVLAPDASTIPLDGLPGQRFEVTMENLGDQRQTFDMEYEAQGPSNVIAGLNVTGPPRVSLVAHQTRTITFGITYLTPWPPRSDVTLVVRATRTGTQEQRVAFFDAAPALVLGPEANTLRLHALPSPSPAAEPFACKDPYCVRPLLNALERDVRAQAGGRLSWPVQVDADGGAAVTSDAALGRWVALDPNGAVNLDLTMGTDGADVSDLQISFELSAMTPSKRVVASGSHEVDLTGAGSEFHLRQALAPGAPTLVPPNTVFTLRVVFHKPDVMVVLTQPVYPKAWILGSAGGIRLPLVEPPTDLFVDPAERFEIQPIGDRHGFANPGQSHLFNFTLINNGHRQANVRFEPQTLPTTYQAVLLPSARFTLPPFEGVTVGLLARVPDGVPQNDQGMVDVRLLDEDDKILHARFYVVATSLNTIPDQEKHYRAAPEDLALVDGGETPGAPFVASWLALGLLVWARRRRALAV